MKQMDMKRNTRNWISPLIAGAFLAMGSMAFAANPTITSIADQTIDEDTDTGSLSFTVGDAETSSPGLTVTRTSSNTTLFPAGSVVFTGTASSRSVTVTPAANQFGTEDITIRVTDASNDTASVTFEVEVSSVNDAPTINNISNKSTNEDTTLSGVSITINDIDDSNSSLSVTPSYTASTLFPAGAITVSGTGSSRSLTAVPAANRFGSQSVAVIVSDGSAADTNSFTITVTAVEDDPTLSGINNQVTTSTNGVFKLMPVASIVDNDVLGSELESYRMTVTVTSGQQFGEITGTLAVTGTLSTVQSALRGIDYLPNSVVSVVGVTNTMNFTVSIKDYDNEGSALKSTKTKNRRVDIWAVNKPPEVNFSLSPAIINDNTPVRMFTAGIQDADGASVTVSLSTPNDPSGVFGSFSPANPSFTGSSYFAEEFIRNVYYVPNENVVTNTASVDIRLTVLDSEGASGSGTSALQVVEVNDPPSINGISTAIIFTDDATSVKPFPSVTVLDPDRSGSQPVTLTLSVNPSNMGTFSPFITTNGITSAEATALLRTVQFIPDSTAVAIGQTETVNAVLTVRDQLGAERSNSQSTIAITGVNGAPQVKGLPAVMPKLVPPSDPRPFDGIWVDDDEPAASMLLTFTLDDSNKGALSVTNTVSGFANPSAGVYTFSGNVAAVSNLLDLLVFTVNPGYSFPQGLPGSTEFELSAEDSLGNTATEYIQIVLSENPRNILVTRSEDDFAVGSLRYALLIASPNDTITFALPSYPAILRLSSTNAVITLDKHLNFKGPGADLLSLSGDSNGNGLPDQQLFRIAASVTMEGLTFEKGTAMTGGAFYVGPEGSLVLRSCVVRDSTASQWGGAIDVDQGHLELYRCLLSGNQTDASLGLGGGAVSLYTTSACSFNNTTFSGNAQASVSGYGGGAIYVESFDPQLFLDVDLTHCTFAENSDAVGTASSVFANGSGSTVWLLNSVFNDLQGRNLEVGGAGDILSLGGNTSDDSTFTVLSIGGVPNAVYLFDQASDQTLADAQLLPLTLSVGSVATHALHANSPAIGSAISTLFGSDQRGVIRDASPDSGAFEYGAGERVLINEVQMAGATDFIEFYIPRDAVSTDLSGFVLTVDGSTNHTFAAGTVIVPGSGILVASATMSGVTNISVVTSSLSLGQRGVLALSDPAGRLVFSASYNADFVDLNSIANLAAYPGNSVTLSPQFSGAAFIPHSEVGSAVESPGADTAPRAFGAENSSPVAFADSVLIPEDEATFVDVLANDSDADGTDQVVITSLSGSSIYVTALGASAQISTNTITGYGEGVVYDPRGIPAIQQLAAGAELEDSFTYRIADVGSDAIESLVAHNGTNAVLITSRNHRLVDGESIQVFGTAGYDGLHTVASASNDTFVLNQAFVGTVTNGSWIAQALRGGSASNDVSLTIIGANDFPVAGPDGFAGTEEEVLRLMADSDLLGSGTIFDTDAAFTVPVRLETLNLLANDSDVDSDDDQSTLTVLGVLDSVRTIDGVSGTVGDLFVTVESAGHGLVSGTQIVVSGYGGHPSYNGVQTITVVDADHFTLPVAYVDAAVVTGVWGILDDGNRLVATSSLGAAVKLEIRADRAETSILYNPLVSSNLNALALGQTDTDLFYYAVSDSHGAVALGVVSVVVTGLNETPVNTPDPLSLATLGPFVGGTQTLEQVLGGLTVLDAASGGSSDRADVRVQVAGTDEVDSVILVNLWKTFEDQLLIIQTADVLVNDSDEDTLDVLYVSEAFVSQLGVPVTMDDDFQELTYHAPTSMVLNALSHNEMLIDSFQIVVSDDNGGFVTNSVALLVVGVNDAPVAQDDLTGTLEDRAIAFDPRWFPTNSSVRWDYDVDQNGTPPDNQLWIVDTNNFTAFGAEFSISNNYFSYDPAVSIYLNGLSAVTSVTDVVEYTLTDQSFIFANDDLFLVAAGGTDYEIDVLANDRTFNVRGGTLGIVEFGIPDSNGSVSTNANGTALIYTPEVNFVGDEIFTYAIQDEWGNYSRGRVTVRVTTDVLNGNLQANADFFTVAAGETVTLPVLFNDNTLPADGATLTITQVLESSSDDLVSLVGGEVRFEQADASTPFPYTTTFLYEVSGGGTARKQALVSVQVVARANTLPTQPDHFNVGAGSRDNLLDVVLNDSILPGIGSLTLTSINVQPARGSVTIDSVNNRLIYTPTAGFVGEDILGYEVIDNLGGTGFGTVRITVGHPVLARDYFVVPFNSTSIGDEAPVVLDVLANDRVLPASVELRVTAVSPASASIGSISIASGGTGLSFLAAEGQTGSATFSYSITDSYGTGSRTLTGDVTVTIAETGVFANADTYHVAQDNSDLVLDVLANDRSLPDLGRSLSVIGLGTGPDAPNQGGTVLVAADNSGLIYTPANGFVGEETFTYTMTDAYGSDAARVTVKVGASVIAASDNAYAVYHEGTNTPNFTLSVLDNDVLLPQAGGVLEILGVGIDDSNGTNAPTQRGSVAPSADGSALVYTPNTNYVGTSSYRETFTYEVGDGSAARAFAQVTIDVLLREEDRDLTRETNADRFSVARNSTGNALPVLNNDGARPGTASGWTITNLTSPTFGGQVFVVDATVVYTPAPDFTGTDVFTYSISDGFGGTAEAEVQVKVGDIMLNADRYTVISGSVSNAMQVLVNDGVLPGPDYALAIVDAGGSVNTAQVSSVSNAVYYTPNPAYAGTYPYVDQFFYAVLDDSALAVTQLVDVVVVEEFSDQNKAEISIVVQGVNDAPRMFGFTDLLETDDKTPIRPYSASAVTDVDEWGDELQTVTIALDSSSKGELVSLGGFTHLGSGIYQMEGTPADVTASLRGLSYVAVENRIPGGTNEVVELNITVSDPFIPTPLTHHLEILVWAANDAPQISGIVNPLNTVSATPIPLFPTTVLNDVDEFGNQLLTAEVILDDPAKGTLTGLGGFIPKTPGRWEMSGTATMLTTALQGLVFEPVTNRLAIGVTEDAGFELNVRDAFVVQPSKALVVVQVTGGNSPRGSWDLQQFGTNQVMAADGLDPDGDQRSNLEEYIFGTNPMVSDSNSNHNLVMTQNSEEDTLTVAYTHRIDDPALNYVLECSDDLSSWSGATLQVLSESSTAVSPGVERTTVTINAAGACRFYRMTVHY